MTESEIEVLRQENRRLRQRISELQSGSRSRVDPEDWKNADQRWPENNLDFKSLVENANSVILKLDPRGIVTYMNKYGLGLFGYHPEEIIGKHVLDTIVPDAESSQRDSSRFVEEYFSDPSHYPYLEHENLLRDGRRIWMAWINRLVYDDQGQVREIISVGSDITPRHKAEKALAERERWLKTMTNNVPVVIAYIDKERRFRFINRSFEEWLGKKSGQILNHPVPEVLGQEVYQAIKGYMDKALRGETVRYERDSKDAQGRDIVLELAYVPHRDETGQVVGYFAVGNDITADRLARREEAKHQKLEVALETAGAVAHEISQPLQTLMGEAEIVQARHGRNSAINEKMELIISEVERLAGITQKLVQLTRYESKEYPGGVNILDLDRSTD